MGRHKETSDVNGGSEKQGKPEPHCSVKSEGTLTSAEVSRVPGGHGSSASPWEQNRNAGKHPDPREGPGTRKIFMVGRRDLTTKGQRVL